VSGWPALRNGSLSWLMKRVIMRDVITHHDAVRAKLDLPALELGPTDTPLTPYLLLQGSIKPLEYPIQVPASLGLACVGQ
jgi:hypothetical protein